MARSVKKALQQEYQRLKKAMEKITNPKKADALSQWVLQPVRHRQDNNQPKKY